MNGRFYARWRITDTLAVPVEVLQVVDGQARIRAASGEKWVPAGEIVTEEPDR